MENEKESLNTEENDIAGNRIDGPVGNTAAKPGRPGTGVGIPGGASASAQGSGPATPPSSEALVASEMSVGQGAVEPASPQENKEANPADLTPTGTYGGNFGNSTQGSYHDEDRRENQDSDANRGEFGAQDLGGTTHGGFGNQNRQADYEPRDSAEDQYYGGPGRSGPQENAYRAYDGRDERPDSRLEYGFERGAAPEAGQNPAGASAHLNDNGAPKGSDSGFAADYGQTSRPGQTTGAAASASELTTPGRRNQTEDYRPAVADAASAQVQPLNRQAEGQPQNPTGFEGGAQQGETLSEPAKAPDFQTGDDRSGYVQDASGDAAQGTGSRGGSYNDAYDDSRPGSKAGSPAAGDQRREDLDPNYGQTARQENRPDDADAEDHGTPHRNAGRDE